MGKACHWNFQGLILAHMRAVNFNKALRILLALFLLMSAARADSSGLMQPYYSEGSYSLSGGKAKIVISKDASGRFQYQLKNWKRGGEGTEGNPDFLKSSAFFVFPEDTDHYWIYDGNSNIVHFVFSDAGMMAEDLTTVPDHFRSMPEQAVKLLPQKLQKKIRP